MTIDDVSHFAQHLLEEHGLAQQGWQFAWDRAKRRCGCCKYGKKLVTLSRHYVAMNVANNPDDVIDTILHEIAHAMTPGSKHGYEWKRKASEIGAEPKRCCDTAVMPEGKYIAKCGGCGKVFWRHKRTKRGAYRYCASCGPERGRLSFAIRPTEAPPPMVPQVPPTTRILR